MYILRKLICRTIIPRLAEIDLRTDEYEDSSEDEAEDKLRSERETGPWRWFWKSYYLIA
jgi:hypothetical protein